MTVSGVKAGVSYLKTYETEQKDRNASMLQQTKVSIFVMFHGCSK